MKPNELKNLSISDLRFQWEKAWGMPAAGRLGRKMLEHSLAYKLREAKGHGLATEQKQRLNKMVEGFLHNPGYFEQGKYRLKPGVRLVRTWKRISHQVIVMPDGFEYNGKAYTSLSQIAYEITGTRWNGWRFFGVRKDRLNAV